MARLGDIVRIVTARASHHAQHDAYVSTDNMSPNVGGVAFGTSKPNGPATAYQPGDVLFSNIRTYFRKVWSADREGTCSPDVLVFRADESVLDTRFLHYVLSNRDFTAHSVQTSNGAKMPRGDKAAMLNYQVELPTLDDQRSISHLLGALDNKIALNSAMNETLETTAGALFRDWFVDFGPVRAKMEGREPYLAPDVWTLFPDGMDGDEKPEGWSVADIYDVAQVIYGAPFSSEKFNSHGRGMPLIRIRDLGSHDPNIYTDEEHPKALEISPGDIVVGMDGEFRCHMWKGPKAYLNQRVCHFRPKPGVPTFFVAESIVPLLAFFERGKVGTTVIHLGKSDIDTFQLTLPPPCVLAAFSSLAEQLITRISHNAQESRSLVSLRDYLAPRLLSGEIRVANAIQIAEAA